MATRARFEITMEVDLDMVPGLFYNPEDWVEFVKDRLTREVPHYHPKVTVTWRPKWSR